MRRSLGQAVCFTTVKYIRQEQIEQVRRERYTTLTGEFVFGRTVWTRLTPPARLSTLPCDRPHKT